MVFIEAEGKELQIAKETQKLNWYDLPNTLHRSHAHAHSHPYPALPRIYQLRSIYRYRYIMYHISYIISRNSVDGLELTYRTGKSTSLQ